MTARKTVTAKAPNVKDGALLSDLIAKHAERIPAETVLALLAELKMTKSQFAQAIGKSPSLVSEFVGHGRGRLVSTTDFAAHEKLARAFVREGAK
jgi:hypothetical protein